MSQKTILITGTNPGGIGNSLAREFHARGLKVFATARSTSAITDLADLGITTLSLEVTSSDSITALRDEITRLTNGRLDYLVNNAGRNYTVPATEIDLDEVRNLFEVNVYGVMAMCQAFAPLLIASKGTIVQIGSLAALMPYVFGSPYNASKAALHAYSDTLRVELKEFGVKVVVVVTGGVKSRLTTRVHRYLKEDSIFLPIEESYNRRQSHSKEVGMPCEAYAKSVVTQLLQQKRNFIWEGAFSWIVWFAKSYLPSSVLDFYMQRTFQLWKLRGAADGKKLL